MAATPIVVYAGASSRVAAGGEPVIAIFGGLLGGYITNPFSIIDQGIEEVEILFVDLVNSAADSETSTTRVVYPGETIKIPATTNNVSVNAATSGHRFTCVVYQIPTPYPPEPMPGPFPPSGPTGMTEVIPSYLYQQYQDDSDCQAFVDAYNAYAQNYIDTFNALNLPVYTLPIISGALLDWVAEGLYGISRPALGSGQNMTVGLLNTYEMDDQELNGSETIGPTDIIATSDDTFKRIITWHYYKADGKVFDVRWLKRRVMRFLIGTNGTAPNIDETYQISVSFGANYEVEIRFIDQVTDVISGSFMNGFELNDAEFNALETEITPLTPLPYRMIFAEAVASGALELPFQFTWNVEA